MSSTKKSKSKRPDRRTVSWATHQNLLQTMQRTEQERDEALACYAQLSKQHWPHTPPALLKQLDELLDHYPAEKLAEHVFDVLQQAIVFGGQVDGITPKECDNLYPVFRFYRALRNAGPLPARELKVEERAAA